MAGKKERRSTTDEQKVPARSRKCLCCGSIVSLVQILFPLFQTHYHQITITKTKEIKFEPRIKLNHNIYSDCNKMPAKEPENDRPVYDNTVPQEKQNGAKFANVEEACGFWKEL